MIQRQPVFTFGCEKCTKRMHAYIFHTWMSKRLQKLRRHGLRRESWESNVSAKRKAEVWQVPVGQAEAGHAGRGQKALGFVRPRRRVG